MLSHGWARTDLQLTWHLLLWSIVVFFGLHFLSSCPNHRLSRWHGLMAQQKLRDSPSLSAFLLASLHCQEHLLLEMMQYETSLLCLFPTFPAFYNSWQRIALCSARVMHIIPSLRWAIPGFQMMYSVWSPFCGTFLKTLPQCRYYMFLVCATISLAVLIELEVEAISKLWCIYGMLLLVECLSAVFFGQIDSIHSPLL